jgi:hypothetical protein
MLLFSSVASAATLNVVGGILQGATDVNVNGTLYNVKFVDGTCQQLFNGCDDPSDFTFKTETDALAAGNALLNQVFLDGPLGKFDTSPELTAGCVGGFGYCLTIIPYGIYLPGPPAASSAVWTKNFISPGGDIAYSGLGAGSEDTTRFNFKTYAQFYPPVPEPDTWLMLVMGFGAIGGAMRRKRCQAISDNLA